MNLNEVKELIRKSRQLAKTENCKEMIDHFEEFIHLYQISSQDPKQARRLDEVHMKFVNSFIGVVNHLGIDPSTLQNQMDSFCERSSYLSPEKKEELRSLMRDHKSTGPKKIKKNKTVKV
jgi:type I site-specific restriction-modification system R (restriction) subunit